MSMQGYYQDQDPDSLPNKARHLAEEWDKVIGEFLKGDIEKVFNFQKNHPEISTRMIEGFSGNLIVMLRTAIEKQRDDAMAYRLLVKFAHDAGVPLISGAALEALKKLAADGQ